MIFKRLLVKDPQYSSPPPPDYYRRVATTHEFGDYGSTGYRVPWSDEESRKLLLRTHTTASSANMLYKLAAECRGESVDEHTSSTSGGKQGGFRPAKLFSIDRVFRNETMDATHLAEFHQVEGVVADHGLTLADLIGIIIQQLILILMIKYCTPRIHASLFQKNGNRKG